MPADYVVSGLGGSAPVRPRSGDGPESPGAAAMAAERAFLALCLGSGSIGRDYLERLGEGHFSSDAVTRARDHLLAHFDDPLADLPVEDRTTAALIGSLATEAAEQESASEAVLEVSFLQLELRRIDREIRRAMHEGDLARQDALAGAKQQVRRELDVVMGQTA